MKKQCISKDWYLSVNGGAFQPVDLPNDYAITQPRKADAPGAMGNGYHVGGKGVYNKYMKLNEDCRYILNIDGAYMCAEISVNGNPVAIHPNGYTPFLADITRFVRLGHTNKIKVITDDLQPSSRWYSGAGIYRDVYLWTGGNVRIEPWDAFIKTKCADAKNAVVEIDYEVSSDIDGEAVVKAEISGCATEGKVAVKAGEKSKLTLNVEVKNPRLWNLDDPQMYTLYTTVSVNGKITDEAENDFGIRTISFDAKNGFRLNGKTVKMRGGCIHHDYGATGVAAIPAAEIRKLSKLQSVGYNAVRSSHNPQASTFLDNCDRMGMLVMDELFDTWNTGKRATDYHLFFADWWQRDIEYAVKRDRNHPCVVSYSTGNEIEERSDMLDSGLWARKMVTEIKKHDLTRPVTNAVCGIWDKTESCDPDDYKLDALGGYDTWGNGVDEESFVEKTAAFMEPLDIVGYNYLWNRVETDTEAHPDRVIWHSETKVMECFDSWGTVIKYPNVIGDFTWTAYDNLGEAGVGRSIWERDGFIPGISGAPYPYRMCFQGDFDEAGFRRPQSYYREANWFDDAPIRIFTTHPEHTGEGFSGTGWHWYDVRETWTFDEKYLGCPVKAEVYTTADRVTWYLNGKQVAECIPEKAIASAIIAYEPGELTAISIRNGVEVGRATVATHGATAHLSVKAERKTMDADGRDLVYFQISAFDNKGAFTPECNDEICVMVSGGVLLGAFGGNPCNEDDYHCGKCHLFEGNAVAVVRTTTPGTVKLRAMNENLASGFDTVLAK